MQRKASLYTLGCRLNQSETNILRAKLESAGYRIVPFGEPADLGVINTCTVTNEADAKSRKVIRSFIRANPSAFTAVIGCYSQVASKDLAEIAGVDLIIGNQEKLNLLDYLPPRKNARPLIVRDRIEHDDFTIETVGAVVESKRANLKIQDGCDFMCSFCIIPFARGRARSRDLNDLVAEAQRLVDRGVKELVLTGVNIGTYSWRGATIVDVVDALALQTVVERLRISSIEPTTIPPALLTRMNDAAHPLVPYLHVPLQSGSDHVLGLMRRRYSRRDYVDFVNDAAADVEDLCIGTDIMVGMPGETDEDFAETCEVLDQCPIAYAHVFKYSARDGTSAARMAEHVPPEVKNRRGAVVRQISARKLESFHRRHLGRVHRVLFEQCDGGYWTGYTENYIRVAAQSNAILENEVLDVRLERCVGEIVLGDIVLGDIVEQPSLAESR